MKSIEKLKLKEKKIALSIEKMTKEQLQDFAAKCTLELSEMIDRVQLFNEHCTESMSKPNYKLSDIEKEIFDRKNQDKIEFCKDILEDYTGSEDIANEIRRLANV